MAFLRMTVTMILKCCVSCYSSLLFSLKKIEFVMSSIDDALREIKRGAVEILVEDELTDRLKAGKPFACEARI